ncbi:MAG TPA: heterodisulfide reductase-related iron-sulfur binding cluster [Xanthobacteraceae bacterium]|nr:heterodisulfide reductase-related iron-sulfur binding cluster [Xanthobacteraceae bacterium]
MQTTFSPAQLADPRTAEAARILRACVHCGFCTATCPTYVLLGDELDSPRGRIYLIKEMLEQQRPASADVVKHIDRCLSCLACMTTCPSGVNYMHLVDHARAHIEQTYRRPWSDRIIRTLIAHTLPYRARFRLALAFASLAKRIFAPVLPQAEAGAPTSHERGGGVLRRIGTMLRLAPRRVPRPAPHERPAVHPAQGPRRGRVVLMLGCANEVLAPEVNSAALRLLTRNGIEVVVAEQEGCCGALVHHMGREGHALAQARRNIDAWAREAEREPIDAILVTASGCGTTIKDYGFMLRTDRKYAARAAWVSGLAQDISEYLATLDIPPAKSPQPLAVAYHAACSLQHGQRVVREPKQLLTRAGFAVREIPEGHLCCGSAGTYNMLQPEIAARLRDRKVANIARVAPDVIATGNVGCAVQIAQGTRIPVVHTVELLDWSDGGPVPAALEHLALRASSSQGFTLANT